MQTNERLEKIFKAIKYFKGLSGNRRNPHLSKVVQNLRYYAQELTGVDPWRERKDKRSWCSSPDQMGKSIIISYGSEYNSDTLRIDVDNIWIDDYKRWIASKPTENTLHTKKRYFRIGDTFYEKSEFFECDGKAYPKKEYVLYKNKAVEKNKVCVCDYYNYDAYDREKHEIVFMADRDEEFWEGRAHIESAVGIEIYTNYGPSNKLRCQEFIKSLFRVGNKRLLPENGSTIYLSKEDLSNFNLRVSESHALEIAKDIPEAITNEDKMRFGTERILKELQNSHFRLFLIQNDYSNTSLKNRLINMIIRKRSRRHYTNSFSGIKELFIRLRAIKEMYETEAEYARG